MTFKYIVLLIFSVVITSKSKAEDTCKINFINQNLNEFIKINDYLGEDTEKFKEYKPCKDAVKFDEGCTLKWGTLIDKSCFEQNGKIKTKQEFDDVWNKFDRNIDLVVGQTNICNEIIGFNREINSFLPVIRRTIFNCQIKDSTEWMHATIFEKRKEYGSRNFVNASFDHHYVVTVNSKNYLEMSDYDNASSLFHEILHFGKNNNLRNDVHNSLKLGYSCDSGIVNDVVYLVMSACFPQSIYGKKLYGNLRKCEKECIKTLTNNFNDSPIAMGGATLFDKEKLIGQPLSFEPHTEIEAKIYCDNIMKIVLFDKNKITTINKKMEKLAVNPEIKANFVSVKSYLDLFALELAPKNIVKNLIKDQEAKISSKLLNICLKNDISNSLICDNNNLAVKEYFRDINNFIDNIDTSKYEKLTELK